MSYHGFFPGTLFNIRDAWDDSAMMVVDSWGQEWVSYIPSIPSLSSSIRPSKLVRCWRNVVMEFSSYRSQSSNGQIYLQLRLERILSSLRDSGIFFFFFYSSIHSSFQQQFSQFLNSIHCMSSNASYEYSRSQSDIGNHKNPVRHCPFSFLHSFNLQCRYHSDGHSLRSIYSSIR